MESIFCYDPTTNDPLSKVRGVGRYLQILKENFPNWKFVNNPSTSLRTSSKLEIFINPFFNFLQKPLTLKRVAKKQIAVIHDLIPLKYPKHFPVGIKGRLNIFLHKLALKKYDLIVTDSHASKKDIINILHIAEEKIKVIYPCLPKVFSMEYKVSSIKDKNTEYEILNTKYCLYVGDATWNKNLVNLAKAIKTINVTCVFVGKVFSNQSSAVSKKTENRLLTTEDYSNPWQKELKDFLAEAKDDKRFIFLGYIPDKDLIQLYQRAKCNILVSVDEGFGFSYLEAASQSCPSVLSSISVLREISKNKAAVFAKPDNPNDIANSIGEVYFNQDLRKKLGKKAIERSKFFSQKKFTNEFNRILNF